MFTRNMHRYILDSWFSDVYYTYMKSDHTHMTVAILCHLMIVN